MKSRSGFGRWLALVSGMLLLALVIAACSGGDGGDATSTPAAGTGTETPAAVSQETPTGEAEPTPTDEAAGTPTVGATATTAAATPTEAAATSTPQAVAATPTGTAATTPTAAATSTADAIDDVLGDVEMLDPEELPNYTLTMRFEMSGIPDEPEDFRLDMEVQQSATDNYHMRVDSDDGVVEIWVVDDVTYLAEGDGEITSIPGTDMGLFSPSMFLATVPPLDEELAATRVGEETVSGRETTRYRIEAANYLALSELFAPDATPEDAEGELNVWIDNELNIMIRQEGDVTWTNVDGTTGRFFQDFLISDIGSTPRVEAPQ